jgi:hypothetical protein
MSPPRAPPDPPDDHHDDDAPRLTPAVVDDDEDLIAALTQFAARDPEEVERRQEAEHITNAIRPNVEPDVWRLLELLLQRLAAAHEDQMIKATRWAFAEGRQHPWYDDNDAEGAVENGEPPGVCGDIFQDDQGLAEAVDRVIVQNPEAGARQREVILAQANLQAAVDHQAARLYLRVEEIQSARWSEMTLVIARWAYAAGLRCGGPPRSGA